jgi:predicted DNA-binding transcriptional regulator AlpA
MVQEPTWRYMARDEVCKLRGVGRTRQYEDEKDGRFPPGERHGMRTIRWRSDVVAAWLEAESQRAREASQDIAARQSKSAERGVEVRQNKRVAATQESATRA